MVASIWLVLSRFTTSSLVMICNNIVPALGHFSTRICGVRGYIFFTRSWKTFKVFYQQREYLIGLKFSYLSIRLAGYDTMRRIFFPYHPGLRCCKARFDGSFKWFRKKRSSILAHGRVLSEHTEKHHALDSCVGSCPRCECSLTFIIFNTVDVPQYLRL